MKIEATEPIDISPGQVHIWYQLTEAMGLPALTAARALLSAAERSRCDRYHLEGDRRDYAAAHALLRSSLSRYYEVEPHAWTFASGPRGKPELPARTDGTAVMPPFNLSHARGIVGCAMTADAAVGIDVERTDLAFDCSPMASRYFSDDEIAQLNRCAPQDRSARFVEIWTLKEAYVKATGQGLSEALRDVAFNVETGRVRFLPAGNVNAEAWQFAVFTVEPHARIAVAVNCHDAPRWTVTRLDPGYQSSGR